MKFLRLLAFMLPVIAINNSYTMNYSFGPYNNDQVITNNNEIEDILGHGVKIENPDSDTLQYIFGEECTNNNCEVTAYFRPKYEKNVQKTIEVQLFAKDNKKVNILIKNGNFYLPQDIEQYLENRRYNIPYTADNMRNVNYAVIKCKTKSKIGYYLASYTNDLNNPNNVVWSLLDEDYDLNHLGTTKSELLEATSKSSVFKLLTIVSKNIQRGVVESNYNTRLPIFDFAYNKYNARTFLQNCINNIDNQQYINEFINRYRIKYYQDANGHQLSIKQLILDIDYFCQIYDKYSKLKKSENDYYNNEKQNNPKYNVYRNRYHESNKEKLLNLKRSKMQEIMQRISHSGNNLNTTLTPDEIINNEKVIRQIINRWKFSQNKTQYVNVLCTKYNIKDYYNTANTNRESYLPLYCLLEDLDDYYQLTDRIKELP